MFPLHCIVQALDPASNNCLSCFKGSGADDVLIDTFAVIANETPLSSLTETVLYALGLPEYATAAVGHVQVRNWKLLALDQITENLEASAEQTLKDVSNAVTLVIVVKKQERKPAENNRLQVVRNLILQKAAVIANSSVLDWITEQHGLRDCARLICAGEEAKVSQEMADCLQTWLNQQSPTVSTNQGTPQQKSQPLQLQFSSVGSAKFNHLIELPKLQRWFHENPNPTRSRLIQYMGILNSTPFRRVRPKIGYQQICNWFSNARAAARKSPGGKVCNTKVRNAAISFNTLMYPESVATVDSTANVVEDHTANGGAGTSESGEDATEEAMKREPATPPTVENAINWSMEMVTTEPNNLPIVKAMTVPSDLIAQNQMVYSQPQPVVPNQHRARLMFDPITEIPMLERWFEENPHPSWSQIDEYTRALNSFAYRETYPPVTSYNVKIWFKNRRAKSKRMVLQQNGASPPGNSHLGPTSQSAVFESAWANVSEKID